MCIYLFFIILPYVAYLSRAVPQSLVALFTQPCSCRIRLCPLGSSVGSSVVQLLRSLTYKLLAVTVIKLAYGRLMVLPGYTYMP